MGLTSLTQSSTQGSDKRVTYLELQARKVITFVSRNSQVLPWSFSPGEASTLWWSRPGGRLHEPGAQLWIHLYARSQAAMHGTWHIMAPHSLQGHQAVHEPPTPCSEVWGDLPINIHPVLPFQLSNQKVVGLQSLLCSPATCSESWRRHWSLEVHFEFRCLHGRDLHMLHWDLDKIGPVRFMIGNRFVQIPINPTATNPSEKTSWILINQSSFSLRWFLFSTLRRWS